MSRHALLIGNSQYDDPAISQLAKPEADIRAVAEVLSDAAIGGFAISGIHLDEPKAQVEAAIEKFFSRRSPDDFLLLYFSGHGIKDRRGILHLAFPNTQRELLRSTAIRDDFIAELMDNSRAEAQLLVLDCCNAAAFGRGAKAETGGRAGIEETYQAVIADQRGAGRMVLAATGSIQYAWEGDEVIGQASNSVFTRWFVEGLRSGQADLYGDGRITLDEFVEYLKINVRATEPDQNPELHARPNAPLGELVIAASPNIRRVPDDVQQALDTLPDPPREDLRAASQRTRFLAIAEAQYGLADPVLGAAYAAVLRYMVEQDPEAAVRDRAQQALDGFAQAEKQRLQAEQQRRKDEKRRAAELDRERARIQAEIEQKLGVQAAAFIQRVNALYEEAAGHFEQGRWEGAEAALGRVRELSPDDPRISDLSTRIEEARAAEALARLEAERRAQTESQLRQARQQLADGNWQAAAQSLQSAQAILPDYAGIADLAAEIEQVRQQAQAAEAVRVEKERQQAAEAERQHAEAEARARHEREQREQTEAWLQQARGQLAGGDWQSATQSWQSAEAIMPDFPGIRELAEAIESARLEEETRQRRLPFEPEMVLIPAGSFLMGSPVIDKLRSNNEPIQFQLDLDYDYTISRYPVTLAQYRFFVEAGGYREDRWWTATGLKYRQKGQWTQPHSGYFGQDDMPVVNVSWYEANAYTRWLTEVNGRDYRLPTEAEWEKAARGGLQIPDSKGVMQQNPNPARLWTWGNEPWHELEPYGMCNFGGRERGTSLVTKFAAQAKRQPYGLYDMAGNVWEWCLSAWADPYVFPEQNNPNGNTPRVQRGGSWRDGDYKSVRCSTRRGYDPDLCDANCGFRIGGIAPFLHVPQVNKLPSYNLVRSNPTDTLENQQFHTQQFHAKPHPKPILYATKTDAGPVRSGNQDAILAHATYRPELGHNIGLFMVADGRGGHEDGKRAAQLAIEAISTAFYAYVESFQDNPQPVTISELLNEAYQSAHRAVTSQVPNAGTTLTSTIIWGDLAYIAHVGDSRAYLIGEGRVESLTRDHSLVRRLFELGQLTLDEAKTHPQRNVLYRCIGKSEVLEMELVTRQMPPDSYMLLCSEGLWGTVEDQFVRILNKHDNLQKSVNLLTEAAIKAGGTDNISIVLVRMEA